MKALNNQETPVKPKKGGLNIDIDKLKETQRRREEFLAKNPDLRSVEIDKLRKQRNEAKKSLVDKMKNTNTQELTINPDQSLPVQPKKPQVKTVDITPQPQSMAPDIKIIKRKPKKPVSKAADVINQEMERLSYTLVIDNPTHDDLTEYRKRKKLREDLDLDARFASINDQLTKYYYIIVAVLIILISMIIILFK